LEENSKNENKKSFFDNFFNGTTIKKKAKIALWE